MTYPDGTSGHSGSDTSQARAERERDNGTKSAREIETLDWLELANGTGLTYAELGRYAGWHHGQASSVLSTLHKEGRILRLSERRNRCKVYVLPKYEFERTAEPHGGRKVERDAAIKQVTEAREVLSEWQHGRSIDTGPHRFDDLISLLALDKILGAP